MKKKLFTFLVLGLGAASMLAGCKPDNGTDVYAGDNKPVSDPIKPQPKVEGKIPKSMDSTFKVETAKKQP